MVVKGRPSPVFPKAPFSLLEFMLRFRWVVVVPVVLPLSFLWAQYHRWATRWATSREDKDEDQRMEQHARRVERVRQRVRSRDAKADGLICLARPTYWSVSARSMEYKKTTRFPVDMGDFVHILAIDEEKMEVHLEPGVNMGQLSESLLDRGLMVPVVPEYDDLTVGGLISGYGIEGSSHKYGLFADTVRSMDLILADGSAVTATKDNEYKDLFFGVQWSQGTVALLAKAVITLQRVTPYVKVSYFPVHGDLKHISEQWEKLVSPSDREWPEFQEGLVFDSTRAVLMSGDYATAEEATRYGSINAMGRWYQPWFYKYVEDLLRLPEGAVHVEYVPTRDYLHRHTRSLYWECEMLLPFGNHPLFRYFLGWLMPPRVSFLKLTTVGKQMWEFYQERHIAQDVLVPMRHTAACLEVSHDLFDIYPIWLNAHRLYKTSMGTMLDCESGHDAAPLRGPGDTADAQMYTDVGIWGVPKPIVRGELYDGAQAQSALEQFLIQHHGYQALYAVTEMSEKDFWTMFDAKLYNEVREKYGSVGVFMDIYYKVHRRREPIHVKSD
uniref:Delta(24)-sterol reductase n=1 Tax=Compsopogon caeruleus TaxID=31354 RepID=A0A7S1XAP7_9RHOD|mmetsp:Transcript_11948/g.24337  ORF Transcript_11948/g.24337 Transcript_11948/m.24337 type:complete len:554 (+) Transcript_11948:138-1799(+)